jgi:glutathione S-transferase
MILYFSPGACSLADHIALVEAGWPFERVRVDLETKRTEDGRDYNQINPKSQVPALVFDNGQVLTENVAILSLIADEAPSLAPQGDLGRYRLLEMLAFISAELHKAFKPWFDPEAAETEKAAAAETINHRLGHMADRLGGGDFLFGDQFSVADAYLFVMLRWAKANGLPLPGPLPAYFDRIGSRPAVRRSLDHEGLA